MPEHLFILFSFLSVSREFAVEDTDRVSDSSKRAMLDVTSLDERPTTLSRLPSAIPREGDDGNDQPAWNEGKNEPHPKSTLSS